MVRTRGVDVATWHNNVSRTGQNLRESQLTWDSVNSKSFGRIGYLVLDGRVHAQPLYLSGVDIGGKLHNVLLAATEADTVYAFDADTLRLLWRKSVLLAHERPSDDRSCSQISPQIGITATPVVARDFPPHGRIYLVAMSQDAAGKYHHRLHALDLTTGAEILGGPTEIKATYPGTGDGSDGSQVIFDPAQYAVRSALLLSRGLIYLGFKSHCDHRPYTGWVMTYGATNLKQISVLNVTPNGSEGGVWMAGAGMAADEQGAVYFADGNGIFDTTLAAGSPAFGNFGNALLKVTNDSRLQLHVADYFAPQNTVAESVADLDLGSGGVMLLPDIRDDRGGLHKLVVSAGKDSNIYVADRNAMGKFHLGADRNYQTLRGVMPNGIWASPAYFNGTVYYAGVRDTLKAYPIVNGRLTGPLPRQSATVFAYPGATPAISAFGTSNAIVWVVQSNGSVPCLHAYRADDLSQELYNSNQAPLKRDHFGPSNKFIVPTVVNGKVFVGTQDGVVIFGLLHPN